MNTAAAAGTFSRNIPGEGHDHKTPDDKNNFLSGDELNFHIRACASNDRLSQRKIYISFYGYAKTICDHYSSNPEDAVEILNDGFLKIFKEIHRYKPAYANTTNSFKGWLRKIMIYTAIDRFRKNQRQRFTKNIENEMLYLPVVGEDIFDQISYEEVRKTIQQLTPAYRLTFNLFVIEGYSHEEISKQLGISVGASKSNLARGRKQMQKLLLSQPHEIKLNRKINKIDSCGIGVSKNN